MTGDDRRAARGPIVLFCADPVATQLVDPDFLGEQDAARGAGLMTALIYHDKLAKGDAGGAVRRVPELPEMTLGVYRGWMLRPEEYELLHGALVRKNIALINDPAAYRHAHLLPESFLLIEALTPRTAWIPVERVRDPRAVLDAVSRFGAAPLIVKDHVKSRKHEWLEACFIPSAASRDDVVRVVTRFLELQGEDLVGGLVFREFVELERIGTHPRSGMPLTREHRIFWLDGRPLLVADTWPEARYGELRVPVHDFQPVARTIRSRFFTMDVARTTAGRWMIVELGDAQVAGLPVDDLATRFYAELSRCDV